MTVYIEEVRDSNGRVRPMLRNDEYPWAYGHALETRSAGLEDRQRELEEAEAAMARIQAMKACDAGWQRLDDGDRALIGRLTNRQTPTPGQVHSWIARMTQQRIPRPMISEVESAIATWASQVDPATTLRRVLGSHGIDPATVDQIVGSSRADDGDQVVRAANERVERLRQADLQRRLDEEQMRLRRGVGRR